MAHTTRSGLHGRTNRVAGSYRAGDAADLFRREKTVSDVEKTRHLSDPHPKTLLEPVRRAGTFRPFGEGEMILLERLFDLTSPADWKSGDPLVFPRNRILARDLGVSVREIQRRLSELEAAGVVLRRPGEGGWRSNRRLDDGSLSGGGGIDLAPVKQFSNRLARQLVHRGLMLDRLADHRIKTMIARDDVKSDVAAIEQMVLDLGLKLPDASDSETGQVDVAASGVLAKAREAATEAAEAADRVAEALLDAEAAGDIRTLADAADAASEATEIVAAAAVTTRSIAREFILNMTEETWGHDRQVVPITTSRNLYTDSVQRLGDEDVLARSLDQEPPIPGLASTSVHREIAREAPNYAKRFKIRHLAEACPDFAMAASQMGVRDLEELDRNPDLLLVIGRHLAQSIDYPGERWSAEVRRRGLPPVLLATLDAVGRPAHTVRRSRAALLNWYLQTGLDLKTVDMLSKLNAIRRMRQTTGGDQSAGEGARFDGAHSCSNQEGGTQEGGTNEEGPGYVPRIG